MDIFSLITPISEISWRCILSGKPTKVERANLHLPGPYITTWPNRDRIIFTRSNRLIGFLIREFTGYVACVEEVRLTLVNQIRATRRTILPTTVTFQPGWEDGARFLASYSHGIEGVSAIEEYSSDDGRAGRCT